MDVTVIVLIAASFRVAMCGNIHVDNVYVADTGQVYFAWWITFSQVKPMKLGYQIYASDLWSNFLFPYII
jgi:hypothetical protein